MDYREAMESTLLDLTAALSFARRPWWIIASAAVQLHIGADLAIRDVDLLIDPDDAPEIFAALGLPLQAGTGDALFRSAWFGRSERSVLPVELFAGFELCEAGHWNPVRPSSRVELVWGNARAFVPDRAELAEMLRRFGREKDLVRAALL